MNLPHPLSLTYYPSIDYQVSWFSEKFIRPSNVIWVIYRSSRPEVFCKKGVL